MVGNTLACIVEGVGVKCLLKEGPSIRIEAFVQEVRVVVGKGGSLTIEGRV